MPLKAPRRHHARAPKHKHTQNYLQAYWPYLPMLAIIGVGLLFGGVRSGSEKGILAYATEMSSSSLLSQTNAQRANNGKAGLKINQQLTTAAQAKANDMIARNYWSHNTPDGQQPWVFVNNAGYKYSKAGENLAYGFATSADTVIGWMNSPTHKANLLDSAFSEVGFGIANGSNYNQSGPETVVVAMYGQPQVLASSSPSTSTSPTKKAAPSTITAKPAEVAQPTPNPETSSKTSPNTENPASTTNTASAEITRAHIVTKGKTPWLISVVVTLTGFSVLLLLLRHAAGFRKIVRASESIMLKHPVIDIMLVVVIMLGYVLSSTSGFIK